MLLTITRQEHKQVRSINVLDIREMIRQMRAGMSNNAIVQLQAVNWRTVARYRTWAKGKGWLDGELPTAETIDRALRAERGTLPQQNHSRVEPFDGLIRALRAQGMEVMATYQRLRDDHGFHGQYSAVWRYVRKIEAAEVGEDDVTVRVETAPGEEAQVDFGYVGLLYDPVGQKLRKGWAFVMTLAWSRHQYVEFVFDQRVETWLTCHAHAFEAFGGAPRRIKLDNLKAAIVKASVDDPQVQRAYRECAEHYGFLISPCRVRTPQHKGKVESGVHYVQRNFMAGRDYRTPVQHIQHANRDVREWVAGTAGQRRHGTTRQRPLERFQAVERATLLPRPVQPYEPVRWTQLKLHRDCYVVCEGAYYSAPYRYAGQRLDVRVTAKMIQLYAEHTLVATHSRAYEAGARVTTAAHLPPRKAQGLQPAATCRERAGAIGPYTAQAIELLLADTVIDRHSSAARLVALADRHSQAVLERACQEAFERGDPSPATIRNMITLTTSGSVGLPAGSAPAGPRPTFARATEELVPRQAWSTPVGGGAAGAEVAA
jgi:transposase